MGGSEAILFYIISLFVIAGSFFAIFSVKNIHALISAFIAFLNIGFLFFILELPFLGVVQIIIFSVCLLSILVVLLLLTRQNLEIKQKNNYIKFFISLITTALFTFLITIFIKIGVLLSDGIIISRVIPSSKDIAVEMFINYGIPFSFIGLYFLSAMLGLSVLMFDIKNGKGDYR
ncbi:NADH-quinone oxidoreductase subunit J [bacterium]|nr:NADH-quinone oxidoreductase subunit J [bacterium]